MARRMTGRGLGKLPEFDDPKRYIVCRKRRTALFYAIPHGKSLHAFPGIALMEGRGVDPCPSRQFGLQHGFSKTTGIAEDIQDEDQEPGEEQDPC